MSKYPRYNISPQVHDEWEYLLELWYIHSIGDFAADAEEYVRRRMKEDGVISYYTEYCDKFDPPYHIIADIEIELRRVIDKYIEEFSEKVKCVKEPIYSVLPRAIKVWKVLVEQWYINDALTFALEVRKYAIKRMEEEGIKYVKHCYKGEPPLEDILSIDATITKDIDKYIEEFVDKNVMKD